ncbi:Tc1-mariner class transposase, partial [Favolaschia claudopus]
MVNRSASLSGEAGWPREDICYAFHVSPRSLYRWRSIFEEFGKRIIGLEVLNAAKEVYFHDSSVMLDELAWHLAIHYDIAISISALQATLARARLTRKVLQTIAVERDEAQRTEYRGCIRDLDESSKDERTLARHHGRAPVGQPAIHPHQFMRDDRYTLTAAMSTQGYIATRIVEGSMECMPVMNPYPRRPKCIMILFLPPYSPDLNPIEESFST